MTTVFGSHYKLIVFDLDGTLIDSLPLWLALYREAFARRNLVVTDKQITEVAFYFAHRVHELGVVDIDTFWKEIVHESESRFLNASPFHGVVPLFFHLKKMGIRAGLFTGTNRLTASNILSKLGIEKYIDVSITGSDVKNRKPHPEGMLRILSQTQLAPTEVLFVGDTLIDLETAKNSEVSFLWFNFDGNLSYMPKESASILAQHPHQFSNYDDFIAQIQ